MRRRGIITATETTPGDVEESAKLMEMVDRHEAHTEAKVQTVVADSPYGTIENFRACHQRGIRSHMADRGISHQQNEKRRGVFTVEDFVYDPQKDTYICPAGQTLHRSPSRGAQTTYAYIEGRPICGPCHLRPQCHRNTKNPSRVIRRHPDQQIIDAARRPSE